MRPIEKEIDIRASFFIADALLLTTMDGCRKVFAKKWNSRAERTMFILHVRQYTLTTSPPPRSLLSCIVYDKSTSSSV